MREWIKKVLKKHRIGRVVYEPLHKIYRLWAVPHRRRVLKQNGPAVLKAGCIPGISASDDTSQNVGGGSFRFGGSPSNPCKMTIKNYESLRKTKGRRTLLDLSDPYLVVAGTNNVNVVTPPDIADYGQLKWSPVARKLYWMPTGGLYLIFK